MTDPAHDKNIISLLIIGIAFVVFLVFFKNQDFIAQTNNTNSFVLVSAIGLALLMLFLYLVSNRTTRKSHPAKPAKRRRR